jgi:hypothetical protein
VAGESAAGTKCTAGGAAIDLSVESEHFDSWDALEAYLRGKGTVLKASDPGMPGENAPLG